MNKSLVIVLVLAIAVAATTAQSVDEPERSHGRVRRGYGCPFNQYECHNHCKGVPGYKGGYCDGFLKMTCRCY
uniref:Defensin n=1 Tax=Argas monolakensis TaxID=34602 RepID=Q09JE6_ARGMO|nr:Defensin [Argas monolakensis]